MKKLLLVLMFLPSVTFADVYFGAGFGQSTVDKFDSACSVIDNGVAPACAGSTDRSGNALKAFAGFKLNPNVGIEAFYVDLDKATTSGTDGGNTLSAEAKAKGFGVSVLGIIPMSPSADFFAKVGAFRWKVDASATLNGVTVSADDTGTDLTYGVGVQFKITNNLSWRGEFETFKSVGGDSTGSSDVDLISASILYHF